MPLFFLYKNHPKHEQGKINEKNKNKNTEEQNLND